MDIPLYRQLADHYQSAMLCGTLNPGERLPSVRDMMKLHEVSLSTALQACRFLEAQGRVEARARAGYFVLPHTPSRGERLLALAEPAKDEMPDPAQFVGVHAKVSEVMSLNLRTEVKINLSSASAAPEMYPSEALRLATLRALRQHPEQLTTMVRQPGHPKFRQAVAKRMLMRGVTVNADDVLVTYGCIEAINLALRAVTEKGDTVAVESPTFYGVLQVLESLGLRALEIPTSTQTGMSLDALELACATYPGIKAVLVVPHLQNPLGGSMPDANKQRLVALCERYQMALIEDDTYGELVAGERPPRALKTWDTSGNVIYCSSLHKSLAPGMRVGWMLSGRWQARIEMLKYAQTRYTTEWTQIALAEYIGSSAFDRHLSVLKRRLAQQRRQMVASIARHFPDGTRLDPHSDGIALWLALPEPVNARSIFDLARAEGILFVPGTLFSNGNRFDHCMRINAGLPFTPDIDAAIALLGRLAGNFVARYRSVGR